MSQKFPETGSVDSLGTILGKRQVTCKYCHQKWLYWEQKPGGNWVLIDDKGEQHTCKEYNAAKEKERNEEFSRRPLKHSNRDVKSVKQSIDDDDIPF